MRDLLRFAALAALAAAFAGVCEGEEPSPPAGRFRPPMLGGGLPAPTLPLTITWDPRFNPVETKAAVVGSYVVIEGDMVIGTVDDVSKAQVNALAAAASDIQRSGDVNGLPVAASLREPAADLIRQVADQPREATPLTATSAARQQFAQLLDQVRRFRRTQDALRSHLKDGRPLGLTKAASDALDRLEAAAEKEKAAQNAPTPPRPPDDPNQPSQAALAIVFPQYYWPGGEIPYYIDPSYQPFVDYFHRACALWTGQTGAIRFRPYRPGDTNFLWVILRTGDGGSSSVGRQPNGSQYLNLLDPRLFPEPYIAHELGHALGLFHEQSRPDRSEYLSLIEANMAPAWISQYNSPAAGTYTTLGTGFDFFSIMLYDSSGGSRYPEAWTNTVPSRPSYPVYSIVPYWQDFYKTKYNFNLTTDVIGLGHVTKPSRYDVYAIEKIYGPAPAAAPAAAAAAPTPLAPGVTPPAPPGPLYPSMPATMAPAAETAQALAPAHPQPTPAAETPPVAPGDVTIQSHPASASGGITITITVPYPATVATSAAGPLAPPAGVVTGTGTMNDPSPPPGYTAPAPAPGIGGPPPPP